MNKRTTCKTTIAALCLSILSVAMAPVAFAASGSVKGINTAPADSPAAAAVAAIASDPALTALVPPAIVKSGIKVSTSVPYPPMEMFAKDGTTPIGVDPSLARAIGNRLGVKVDVINVDNFNAQIPGIISGRYHMLMSTMTDTKEREGKISFVDYLIDSQGFLIQSSNPHNIHKPLDMCGKTLAVVANGSALALGQKINKECKAKGKPEMKILKFVGDSSAILAVRSGRAAADIEDYPVAAYNAKQSDGKLTSIPIESGKAPLGIGIKTSNKKLISAVTKALESLIADGSYVNVLKAWNVQNMAVSSVVVNGAK